MMAALPMADPPEMPDSYWLATAAPCPPVPEFDGSEKAETVVIGAGYTGLSAALHLAEQGQEGFSCLAGRQFAHYRANRGEVFGAIRVRGYKNVQ